MNHKTLYIFSMLFALFIFSNTCYSEQKYFLCGPDEDGCPKGEEKYCSCTPYNTLHANEAYCLDMDKQTCQPLSSVPNCAKNLIFKDQGQCLATMMQSEPEPPCPLKTETFCKTKHVPICDADGHPQSCH